MKAPRSRRRRAAGAFALAVVLASARAEAVDLETRLTGSGVIRPDPDQDWAVNLGFGVSSQPDFLGSDDFEAVFQPLVDVEYRGRAFLSTRRGAGVFVLGGENFRIGPRLTYDPGRDNSENSILRGLEDIDGTLEAGILAEAYLGPVRLQADVRRGIAGRDGHRGVLVRLDAAVGLQVGRRDILLVGANLYAANGRYMDTFFSVPEGVEGLAPFDADGGLRDVNLYLSFVHHFDRHWYITVDTAAGTLLGDANSSPIADPLDNFLTQFFGGVLIGYRF